MSHATPLEIHDHVYGFAPSPHVASCDACRGQADAVAAERDALRESLSAPEIAAPPELLLKLSLRRRRRDTARKVPAFSAWGVAAASVILAALGWLLFHDPQRPTIPITPAAPQAPDEHLDRLIAELKSPNLLRHNAAWVALAAYGEAAREKLAAAGGLPGYRFKPQDAALRRRCETERISFDSFSITFERSLLWFRDYSADEEIHIEDGAREQLNLGLQTECMLGERTVHDAMRGLIANFGGGGRVNVFYENGKIVVSTDAPLGPARAPVRALHDHESAPVLTFALRTPDEAKREQSKAALARLGFGAEKALWTALDAPEPHVRDDASELLRRLYTPREDEMDHPSRIDMMRKVGLPVDRQDASLFDVLNSIPMQGGMLTAFDPDAEAAARERKVSYRFAGSWYGHFTMLLDAAGMHFVAGKDKIVIRKGDRSADPSTPIWTTPAEAKRVQTLIDALASPDPKVEEEAFRGVYVDSLEAQALAAARQAAWLAEGPVKERARALRRKLLGKIFERDGADVFSGAAIQKLAAPQAAILQRRVDARGKLEKILADAGVKCRLLAHPREDRSVTLNGVRIVALLRALTHPYGLDFYMDGETVVVDTAANVRAAVENR